MWDVDRLESHGQRLATASRPMQDNQRCDLRQLLRANARDLQSAYAAIVDALRTGRSITPAAQWIVDNFHVISEQLGDVPLRLTPRLWRQLPATGHVDAVGWPRILHIATEYLRHSLWQFNPDSLQRLLAGYQSVAPLKMHELWALYPVLRIALMEELRRIAVRAGDSLAARAAADELADRVVREGGSPDTLPVQSQHLWPENRFTAPFIVQLAHRLQGMGDRGRDVLESLSRELARHDTSIDGYLQRQHARRSASNVAARNIITSLRALAACDWRVVFEKSSHVESLLRERADYGACDRRTRDRYRDAIEKIAIAAGQHEVDITVRILAFIEQRRAASGKVLDLGDWLIGARRPELEIAQDWPPSTACRVRRWLIRHAPGLYPAGIAAGTVLVVALALRLGTEPHVWSWLLLGVLAVFPASELVIGILNRVWLRIFPPRHLPTLALESGLAADMKTLVVIPTLLRSPREAQAACRQLHVHALANPDPMIRFALLTDWTDSSTASREDDAEILAAARAGIAALNRAAPPRPDGEPMYYLLHRRRRWCRTERCFTGWERKRGKLVELNRLLLGRGPTSFMPDADGVVHRPEGIHYVFTVDADTRLPLGCVRDLVGTAAHPMHRPVISRGQRRVVRGYGVLQPRITPLLPGTEEHSLYREIISSESGVDPYAAAVSDLHQDVFGEGLFTGKGLYDLAAWEEVLGERVPDETLLSHDLFEGLFARCALVSDIELFEDFPSHSEVAAARAHRWMRGDWQLLPWILGRHGALPRFGRWKMLDNLRRSLLAPCSMALLIVAFTTAGSHPLRWLLLVALGPALWPAFGTALGRLLRTPWARSRRVHLYRLLADMCGELARAAVSLALLAQNAWLAIDAMCRALYRMSISRRHLLEWTTAAQLKAGRSDLLASFTWPMKGASIVVLAAVAALMTLNPPAFVPFLPVLALWWLSPLVARYLSRSLDKRRPDDGLGPELQAELRGIARSTWTFFEEFVTADSHFLPPDNFQEDPRPVIAHRTSPTNFGLYLLAAVAARDFGWLGLQELCARLRATLATLHQLRKFEGHFLNWYDTNTLAPLSPAYVSTVDSGNLAGHLLALRQACLGMLRAPLLSQRAFTGPFDALDQCRRTLAQASFSDPSAAGERDKLLVALRRFTRPQRTGDDTLEAARRHLQIASDELDGLIALTTHAMPAEATRWLRLARRDLGSHLADLRQLLPTAPTSLSRDATLEQLAAHLEDHATGSPAATQCRQLHEHLAAIAEECSRIVTEMSFGFLYDRSSGLFSIGYQVAERMQDSGRYDLLASEARLASLVAIAKGDVGRSHWRRLGRRLTGGSRHPVLASWSGSMFEYLMPGLVMDEPQHSLLEQTNRRVVQLQIEYGERHQLPWGISESAYNVRDREFTYQYSGFGLPSLGLKRGLSADYVVAPYACAMAAMYRPIEALQNFRALARAGARGQFGFREALDFTPARIPAGKRVAVVRAYMAHHQGMSLVALDNVLHDNIMHARFHAEPCITAADLLLQERRIRFAEAPALVEADVPQTHQVEEPPEVTRIIEGYGAPTPVAHLLSNRTYAVMLTDSGAGYSSSSAGAVTRWRQDATRDCWGSFIYLYDTEYRRLWSAGFQPTAAIPDEYRVHFHEECVIFERRDGLLRTTTSVVVAPDDDAELRQVVLRNDSNRVRHVELTSYAEIVLAPQAADIAHPGFSNLFVQTEFAVDTGALLATRRPRSGHESRQWAIHVIAGTGARPDLQYETDRLRFLGRGRSNRMPQVIDEERPLSNTVGNVLDPIFSLRTRVAVPPRGSATVTFATCVAGSRAQALALIDKYRTPGLFEHVVASAWTFARAELYYLQSSLGEAMLFQTLASHLLVATRQLRAGSPVSAADTPDVSGLWRYAISGDRPILLIRCHSPEELPFIEQCLRAQEYLRIKRAAIDVVILNQRRHSYVQDLQHAIEHLARTFSSRAADGENRGGIHALSLEQVDDAERRLLESLARVVLDPAQGSLLELLSRPVVTRRLGPPELPARGADPQLHMPPVMPRPRQLSFHNGWGGFDQARHEYFIGLPPLGNTPAPWSNVLANEQFGTLVTERGAMCTWSLNSRENQLTAWSNDPVSDPSGEAFYCIDEDGEVWSPAAQPVRRGDAGYSIRHGQGYSQFDVSCRGFETSLLVLVAPQDPVKLCRLRITNRTNERRRLTVASYVEWTLGASRAGANHNIQTRIDEVTGAQLAGNPALIDFGARVAFCDLGGRQQYCTDSRHEFLGRNGAPEKPAGLATPQHWSTGHGPGQDPCCAFALGIDLAPGASDDVLLLLGQAADAQGARDLILRHRDLGADAVLEQVSQRWNQLLGAVNIRTPDAALDLLFNRWLLYQTISCRLWARAAFYQAGGAYGFRDQLQDGLALLLVAPTEVRQHLLRAAARQYPQGDVQHWWHPPSGRGVRTHISDDRIWLPYAVSRYVEVTKDLAVLDEAVPFIDGPALPQSQEDAHYVPAIAAFKGSLYEHCARALECSFGTGVHGLPLMGGGDWNDGMNRVGWQGRGESVWLAWFLIDALRRFIPLARARRDVERAQRWEEHAAQLASACERSAWDGRWYRRAFFDDGTPLGSSQNTECRIDSLAQSWAVLSGAADVDRARQAMEAVERNLVQEETGLVLLFAPPFDSAPVDPGYIKGYLPGLRENGGQYTHAAIWVLMAEAALGNRQRVGELLRMLNPIRRSDSREAARIYRVEPYVVAADVYSGPGIAQRGGWTWYTGAAGWLHQAVLEYVLGLRVLHDTLRIKPCVPDEWPSFEVNLRLAKLHYVVRMERTTTSSMQLSVDGAPVAGDTVPLLRDGREHHLVIHLPKAQ